MPIGRADLGLGLGFFPGGAWGIYFYLFLYLSPVIVFLVIRRRWRMAAARAEEVRRLAWMAAEEASRAEIEAAALAYAPPPPPEEFAAAASEEIGIGEDFAGIEMAGHPQPVPPLQLQQCAVCYEHTTRRCAGCKAVRYCGGKCQITHWRLGHKDECHRLRIDEHSSGQESASNLKGLKSDQSSPCENSSELHRKFQTESDQSNPCENSSELGGKFQTKPVETLFEIPSSESEFSSDIFSEDDHNETKLFVRTSGTESSSDSFVDSSSWSSSLSSLSSAAQPLPSSSNCSTSSLHETYDDASVREDSRMNQAKVGISSCDNNFPDSARARASDSEPKLTKVSSASLSVNNLSCTSKLEPMVSSCKAKDVECRLTGPAGTTFTSSCNGTNSGHSKDAHACEGAVRLNAGSSQQRPTKLMPIRASSSAETLSHQNTLSGVASQSNLRDFKAVGVDKPSSVFSGRVNDECFEKSRNLKPQQSLSSVHHESPSGGRHSFSHDASSKTNMTPTFPSKSSESIGFVPNGISDLKASVRRVVQQFKSTQHSKSHLSASKSDVSRKHKTLFPYDLFVKLYNFDKVELHPCGLTNCGNSCYANAVLQCLAFTRPLTSYLLQGFHSKTCTNKEWCFTCEFGSLLAKSKQGQSPVSPIGILSHIQNIGSNLGHGREEDAHEFLRYAIDTMQTVCLKEAGVNTAADKLAEETTLIQLIFGGYLRSKIKCTRCRGKSERRERMMDLTVEIHGDIGTLEDALARFTATEILDGENKYQCNRSRELFPRNYFLEGIDKKCKTYERAKKKLSVLEAPNVLTIALKRFQSGKFGKLNKAVRFPEHLNLAPYMSGTDDKFPVYSLYAVVVHQDFMNAAFSGHYVCYVKSTQGKWYKTDDSKVKPVEIESVLTKNAYMLLYARCLPRAPSLIRNPVPHDHLKTKKSRQKESPLSGPGASVTRPRRQDRPPFWSHPHQSSFRSSDLFPRTDSSSDSSSLFSCSDEGSCSTESTRDSTSTDEYSEYLFGDSGRFSWSQASVSSEVSDGLGHSPLIRRESEGLSYGERLSWERREDVSLSPFLYSGTTNQCRKLTEEEEDRGRENGSGVGLNEVKSSLFMRSSSTSRERRA